MRCRDAGTKIGAIFQSLSLEVPWCTTKISHRQGFLIGHCQFLPPEPTKFSATRLSISKTEMNLNALAMPVLQMPGTVFRHPGSEAGSVSKPRLSRVRRMAFARNWFHLNRGPCTLVMSDFMGIYESDLVGLKRWHFTIAVQFAKFYQTTSHQHEILPTRNLPRSQPESRSCTNLCAKLFRYTG
jgi:hypothetical protein